VNNLIQSINDAAPDTTNTPLFLVMFLDLSGSSSCRWNRQRRTFHRCRPLLL
jgi:hypothetical protein